MVPGLTIRECGQAMHRAPWQLPSPPPLQLLPPLPRVPPPGYWHGEVPPLVMVAFMEEEESSLFTKRVNDEGTWPSHCTPTPQPAILVQLPDCEERGDRFKFGWKKRCQDDSDEWHLWSNNFERGPYKAVLGFSMVSSLLPKLSGCLNGELFEVRGSHCDEAIVSFFMEEDFKIHLVGQQTSTCARYMHLWRGSETKVSSRAAPCEEGGPLGIFPSVPAFSKDARGMPKDWNRSDTVPKTDPTRALYWGRRAKNEVMSLQTCQRQVNVSKIIEFLRKRPSPQADSGTSVAELLLPPIRWWHGWFCFPLRDFRDEADEDRWKRAWHGSKIEAMYSVLYHNELSESADVSRGERFFAEMEGVYVHKDATASKANSYIRFTPLCGDSVFWAAKWEVRVDKRTFVKPRQKTDQWVFRATGVRLAALWVCGRTADEMVDGEAVARVWDPLLEAHPLRIRSMFYPGPSEDSTQKKAAASKARPKRRPEVQQGVKLGLELPELPNDRSARSDSSDEAVAAARSLSSRPGPIVPPQRYQGLRLRDSPRYVEARLRASRAALRARRAAEGLMPGCSVKEAIANSRSRHSSIAGKRDAAGGQHSVPSAEVHGAASPSTHRSRSPHRDRCRPAVRLRSRSRRGS